MDYKLTIAKLAKEVIDTKEGLEAIDRLKADIADIGLAEHVDETPEEFYRCSFFRQWFYFEVNKAYLSLFKKPFKDSNAEKEFKDDIGFYGFNEMQRRLNLFIASMNNHTWAEVLDYANEVEVVASDEDDKNLDDLTKRQLNMALEKATADRNAEKDRYYDYAKHAKDHISHYRKTADLLEGRHLVRMPNAELQYVKPEEKIADYSVSNNSKEPEEPPTITIKHTGKNQSQWAWIGSDANWITMCTGGYDLWKW